MRRVFIIGWDGATFDLIRPWVAEGKLPTIAKLMEGGSHGLLRSTLPPMTFPAWTSFMTGKNPGKHGIYDFTRRLQGKYQLEFVNGGQRREKTFWRILSEAGRKVVAISIPCTSPPDRVNGIMISGFDAPGSNYVDPRGMHPPELYQELEQKAGHHHPISCSITKEINEDRPDLALQLTLETIRQKGITAKYLAKNKDWDCFMMLFGESDRTGHYFWKYCDPQSPLFVDHATGVRQALFEVYQELDRQAADLLALLPADTTVLMMSDHGFGGVSNCMLYPNCWLREQGFLQFKGKKTRRFTRALEGLKLRIVARIPTRLKRALMGRFNRYGPGRFESYVRYGMIDWTVTQAYFDENPYYPFLWINLQGRQPKGTVAPDQYEQVRDRLIRALEDWRHPETGAKVVEKAYRREEVYSGASMEDAPDIVVKWGLHKNYNYAFKLSSKSTHLHWMEVVDPNQPEHLPYFTGKSGHHRDDGIFVAQGESIRSGYEVQGSRIIDLAPTILHMLGVAVPQDMDGRVLSEIFSDGFEPEMPIQRSGEAEFADAGETNGTYSAEDEEKIADRLQSLGYID
jgi:predicted AlkP superfamily phosphohydrolase/phosphomutase